MRCVNDIAYGPQAGQLLDLILPDGAVRACCVFMHGGGLTAGTRRDLMPAYEYWAARGIATASVEYRMLPQFGYPVFIEDSAAAAAYVLRRLRPEYGLGENVFVGGSSAGAYISMMLAFDRSFMAQAGVEPEEFAGYIFDAGQPTTHFALLESRGMQPLRCIIDETAPLWHVQDARPGKPLLFIAAENDMPARNEQNALMRRVLINFGYPAELLESVEMRGYGHCGYCGDILPNGDYPYARICAEFIERHIHA